MALKATDADAKAGEASQPTFVEFVFFGPHGEAITQKEALLTVASAPTLLVRMQFIVIATPTINSLDGEYINNYIQVEQIEGLNQEPEQIAPPLPNAATATVSSTQKLSCSLQTMKATTKHEQ